MKMANDKYEITSDAEAETGADVSAPDTLAPITDAPVGLGDAPVRHSATKSALHLRKTVATALFAALAFLGVFVFRFQVAGFLTFDFKDAVMTVGSLWLGPVAGVLMAAVVAFFEFISVSSTGPYGLLMNFISSASFILPAAILFRSFRRQWSAIVGLVFSVIFMVAVMIPMNLLITPLYSGAPRSVVADMIPGTLLPFNVIKGTMNAALTALLFQPVRRALKGVKILPPDEERRRAAAWILPVVAGVVAVAAVLIFFFVLDGKFSLFR